MSAEELEGVGPSSRPGLRTWFSLVRFSHSAFALPFALMGAWLGAGGAPEPRVLVLVLFSLVAARTAAMAFNRLLDRDIDAANPRTRGRELPRGALAPGAVLVSVLLSSGLFVASAFLLNPLAGKLSLPVLLVLLAYSGIKRIHWASHAVLGLGLALAPLGAWVAVRGDLAGDLRPPLLLAAGVLTWMAGFDLIYACQDADFDRRIGLHSVPARFGVPAALRASSLSHVLTLVLLAAFASVADLGWVFWTALGVAAVLLVWQHAIVSTDDLSRVDLAFFTLNGWVGVGLFLGLVLDGLARRA